MGMPPGFGQQQEHFDDPARETALRMLRDARQRAEMVSWLIDVNPAGKIAELRSQLRDQTFTFPSDEAFEAGKVTWSGILDVFEKSCASGDPDAALDRFKGVLEEMMERVRKGE